MIELRDVTRRFGATTVLDGICLSVEPGSFMALLGPSGCGKSTLLRIIAGLDVPTAGTVLFDGRDVAEADATARNVAMVFQSYALYPHLTVAENIALPLAMRRLSAWQRSALGRVSPTARAARAAIGSDVAHVAAMLGIEALLARKPAQLSGGQKQRVALARALVRDPSVFLLDEPLSNLDAKLRVQMRGEIVALNRRTGRTFIHVTHDQAEAMAMADRVAVMLGGRIAQCDTPRGLYERPASTAVAGFVGTHTINLLPGPAAGGLPPCLAALAPAAPTVPLVAGLRPEHLTPDPAGTITVRLDRVEYQGAEVLLETVAEDGTRLAAIAPGDWPAPVAGSALKLAADPARLHLFDAATGLRLPDHRTARAA